MDNTCAVKMFDVGVTVCRMQIDAPHPAHIELIYNMLNTHKRLIVVFGLSPHKCTAKNPLSFNMRKQAFFETFKTHMGRIKLLYLNDHRSDVIWSENLDKLIANNVKHGESVRLCGGRDSFLKFYNYTNTNYSIWHIKDFVQTEFVSATTRRAEIAAATNFNLSFRQGVIYTASNVYPQCIPAVDVILLNREDTHVLMGQRLNESGYRFMGTWVRTGETFEDACVRALLEKASLNIDALSLTPQKSFTGFDWRFRGERDSLVTMLYTAYVTTGQIPEPADNFVTLKWVYFDDVLDVVDEEHFELAKYYFSL